MNITPLVVSRFLTKYAAFASSILLGATVSAQAGSFVTDFNSGVPAGSAVFGNAVVSTNGGFSNSGCLKLTTTTASQTGTFVITNDLDAGQPVVSFTASFKALVGGGSAADGFSFNFAPDLPFGVFPLGEEGAGTGLTVEFDTFLNTTDPNDAAPSIDVKVGGFEVATASFPGIRANAFVDVVIQLNPDSTLDVYYDGVPVYTNLFVSLSPTTGGHFGFGARTGGQNDNHFIDNLNITTFTNAQPFVQSFAPIGRNVRGDSPINITLSDNTSSVDTNTIVLTLDGTNVASSITQSAPSTLISFTPPALFTSGSTHSVSLTFADNATPTPNTNTFQYGFTVATYTTLPTNLIATPSLVSANPGFTIRVSQIDVNLGPTLQRAENQLANRLIDPTTSLPYTNLATPNPIDASFIYQETNTLNYSLTFDQGNFTPDISMPGIPGTTGGATNIALDAVTYLHLTPGLYTLGVNSSDGFKLTEAANADVFATQARAFDGVRAAADSTFTFAVTQTGYYPFRVIYFAGGLEPANPGTTDPSLEFFSTDVNGVKTLVNDTNVAGYIPAFQAAATKPYISVLNPAPGDTGVPRAATINATLVDGSITVQTNTIQIQLNGVVVTPAITSGGAGITSVQYQPATPLSPNSTNTVQIAFTDTSSTRRTNSYQFVVENILTQLWAIPPASAANPTWAKWITSAGTERGLAYNPKTGHVLVISRNSATGADGPNALGVGVFDGNTGLYIKQLNLGTIASTGVGTFKLNMIDIADDGAIYACNLTTSWATVPLIIYRWQDENSTPTTAFSGLALGGSTRCGDDFVVRRSGAGTQILVSGNSAVNTVPIFSTTDGINFTGIALSVANLPNASVRLGLAFGCGNTFYGQTTANSTKFVSFNSPTSTVASLTASYAIYDKQGSPGFGPIGVDIANQRLIGDLTLPNTGSSHSMNLFDLNALVVAPTTNSPVDAKPFAVSVGTFGTGSVDFTPDGSRLYTLDSGSGIIAFSLAPKLAAPSICSQPQNYIVPRGGLGFFDVGSIGSLQNYQWRLNGANLAGATNRTLDLPNVQLANLGNYTVVITNSLGLITSSIAVLDFPLVITNQPVSQVVAVGGAASFSVAADGNSPFTYQWSLNGTNVAGATLSSLTINNAQQSNAGGYTVLVTDPLGQTATSLVASLTVGTLGNGTGLNGDYYSNQLKTFASSPDLNRIDPTIDFDFGSGSPDPLITVDNFTIRWTGQVQPLYSQTYTFYTRTDDGARLWVNGQKIVDRWIDQGPTEASGTISLVANQKYDIIMEYYEHAVGAVAQLSWSSLGQVKQIIPQTQLYPGVSAPNPKLTAAGVSNGTNLILNWTGSYTLQSSPNVEGPYVDVTGSTSPYTNDLTANPQMFFRLISE
ncbi:PA14 domain-containing protein [Pedosphaera parvula]|uniref:PA14 domain-containing protein n=1 Tax=Pedosphaera parvula TaxID=1032527 RepID=UPI00058D08C8|nr:PA14 domain-containing protein [Pedosphaera parvula]